MEFKVPECVHYSWCKCVLHYHYDEYLTLENLVTNGCECVALLIFGCCETEKSTL